MNRFSAIELTSIGTISALSFIITKLCIGFLFEEYTIREIWVAWGIAVVFNLSGYFLKKGAIGKKVKEFFVRAVFVNMVKSGLFLVTVLSTYFIYFKGSYSFVLATFIAYFILLFNEVALLYNYSKELS